jgi:hypothetical protein
MEILFSANFVFFVASNLVILQINCQDFEFLTESEATLLQEDPELIKGILCETLHVRF